MSDSPPATRPAPSNTSSEATADQGVEGGSALAFLQASSVTRMAAIGLLILALIYTAYFAKPILLPIFLALLLTILLMPAVRLLTRLRLPQTLSAFLVVAMLGTGLAAGTVQLAGPAAEHLDLGPNVLYKIERKLAELKLPLRKAQETTEKIAEIAKLENNEGQRIVVVEGSLTETLASQAQSILTTLAITTVLLFFLLAAGPGTANRIVEAVSQADQRRRLKRMLLEVQWKISVYLRTFTLISLALGVATAAAMWALDMPSPWLWGALAAVLNFLPYIGPAITAVIIASAALLNFDSWTQILMPPLAAYALTVLEGQFITPLLLGRQLTLNPILVFLAVIFWGWLWGLPGALLAVPILTIGKIVLSNMPGTPPALRAAME
ncbi:AI-2E family transporter [Oceanibaculum indicum]|uniref:Putative PurR-regulated permease PerM n=1 Tax=Oceanibaculum indicum TaxID=526216 RepID=A0A420WQU8_9PROT|nr:AI-2E family transporter [Oceanibaculum indicum]RKQ73369.1 putative PurR-regulated permease PerM [Oceanibaculum indicum]